MIKQHRVWYIMKCATANSPTPQLLIFSWTTGTIPKGLQLCKVCTQAYTIIEKYKLELQHFLAKKKIQTLSQKGRIFTLCVHGSSL
jgi:hypothetical protein